MIFPFIGCTSETGSLNLVRETNLGTLQLVPPFNGYNSMGCFAVIYIIVV